MSGRTYQVLSEVEEEASDHLLPPLTLTTPPHVGLVRELSISLAELHECSFL